MTNHHLRKLFSQAYILGGSPCSGKSTIAELLSARFGFPYYKADNYEPEHMRRSRPDLQPVMFKYSKMSWDDSNKGISPPLLSTTSVDKTNIE